MKHVAPLLLGSLAWTACSVADTASSARGTSDEPVPSGHVVTLRPGEVAARGDMRVGFDAVLSDSRCPKGERCITAGEATVRVWLQWSGGLREPRVLRLDPSSARGADANVQLLALDPYPVSGRTTAPGDYSAVLVLRPIAAAPAARASAADTASR